jgi:hypothetical protein
MTKLIPSHVIIVGHRTLTSYEGQPQTCYGCGQKDHMYHAYQKRRTTTATPADTGKPTWADITAKKAQPPQDPKDPNTKNMDIDPY